MTWFLLSFALAAEPHPLLTEAEARESELRACGGTAEVALLYLPPASVEVVSAVPLAPQVRACFDEVLRPTTLPAERSGLVWLSFDEPPFAAPADGLGYGGETVDLVIKADLPAIRGCYQETLTPGRAIRKQPRGKVSVRFGVWPDGRAVAASIATQDWDVPPADLPGFEACVLDRFAALSFPPPPGRDLVVVTYPFVFAPH